MSVLDLGPVIFGDLDSQIACMVSAKEFAVSSAQSFCVWYSNETPTSQYLVGVLGGSTLILVMHL